MVVDNACGNGIGFRFCLRFCYQRAKGGKSGQLAVGKKIAVIRHAKGGRAEPARIFRHGTAGVAFRCRNISRNGLLNIRRKINAPMFAFAYNCH